MSVRRMKAFEHELVKRHFHQIVCRKVDQRPRMFPIWGATWVPGDRTHTFLGKLFRPLGSPVMMVQVSYPLPEAREGIALFGVAASVTSRAGDIAYDSPRLKHRLDLRPRINSGGPVLDPRDESPGSRAKGAWLRLALRVERCRARAVGGRWPLPEVPRLPQIYFGFSRKEAARYEVTLALQMRAVAKLPNTWTGRSLQELASRFSEASETQRMAFAALVAEDQEARLREAWDSAFIAPGGPENSTGLWLLPQELTTDAYSSLRGYEYFGGIVGAPVYNPARELARPVANPTVELAREAGFNVLADLAALAETVQGSPKFLEVEERLVGLVPVLRTRVRASAAVSDEDLIMAICDPNRPVAIAPALDKLSEHEQAYLLRDRLLPHVSACCTDADLVTAAQQPNGPLWASGMCQVQTLRRDMAVAPEDALRFSPERLERDRVSAQLWYDEFRTANREPQPALAPEPPVLAV